VGADMGKRDSHSVALLGMSGGTGHAVSSRREATVSWDLWEAVDAHYDAERLSLDLSGGVGRVQMLCGRFSMDMVGSEALVAALPPVMHLRGHGGPLVDWLAPLLRLLSVEVNPHRMGGELARSRLVDLMLIGAIRRWLDECVEEGDVGWLSALTDPVVGKALGHLHAHPERPWTVPDLASSVGLSRSPFAARFKAQVGISPMKYLTSWRMRVAARQLRRGRSVGEVAGAVGYESGAAFSRVFKKEMGVSPSTFRPSPR